MEQVKDGQYVVFCSYKHLPFYDLIGVVIQSYDESVDSYFDVEKQVNKIIDRKNKVANRLITSYEGMLLALDFGIKLANKAGYDDIIFLLNNEVVMKWVKNGDYPKKYREYGDQLTADLADFKQAWSPLVSLGLISKYNDNFKKNLAKTYLDKRAKELSNKLFTYKL